LSCQKMKPLRNSKKPFRIVALGGTFDCFHKGHEALILKALNIGEKVIIGLTSDDFAKRLGKSHPIQDYGERKGVLEEFLKNLGANHRVEIVSLNDPYGIAAESPEIEALIVSEETEPRGHELNKLREERGLKPLSIIVVSMVLGVDGKPISSTAIRLGRIRRNGSLPEIPDKSFSQAS